MRDTLTRIVDVVTRKRALGASHELLRVFLVCTSCGRIVPYYVLIGRGHRGCKCGTSTVRVGIPTYLGGAAWVLGCLVWRKWVRRLGAAWDPRAPWRASDIPTPRGAA